MRPRLEPVREILRHLLPPRLAPRPAEEKRLRLRGAQQQSRPLRAVEPLVPRHRRECRAPAGEVHLQHARRLRRVHDQRHAPRAAERRNLRDGRDGPEHVRDVIADGGVRPLRQCLRKALGHGVRVKQRRVHDRDRDVRDAVEHARDGVVLIARDRDPAPRAHECPDRDVQPVRRVLRKDHLLRPRRAEEGRRLAAAAEGRLLGQAHRAVPAAAGRGHRLHRAGHRLAHAGRLFERRRARIEIDHPPISS